MKKRSYRLERLKSVEREFKVSRLSLSRMPAALQDDPRLLSREELRRADLANTNANLEATYLLRLFAEFEAALRDVWEKFFKQTTTPPMRDLIDSIAARR